MAGSKSSVKPATAATSERDGVNVFIIQAGRRYLPHPFISRRIIMMKHILNKTRFKNQDASQHISQIDRNTQE